MVGLVVQANEATLNRMDVLIGHAMGLQDIVLAEIAGHKGGSVVFAGFGLVAPAARLPAIIGWKRGPWW